MSSPADPFLPLLLEASEHMQAGRLQRAVGTFIDQQGDVALYFTILHLQVAVDDDLALN